MFNHDETFPRRLRRLRMRSGKTASQVAREIGVPVSTYRDWENGRAIKGEPYLEISRSLNISINELFTGAVASTHGLSEKVSELCRLSEEIKKVVQAFT